MKTLRCTPWLSFNVETLRCEARVAMLPWLMLRIQITRQPSRKRLFATPLRAFMNVDISGTSTDLECLRDGLRSVAISADSFEIDVEVGESVARLCVYRSRQALALLETEQRVILAGDRAALENLASCIDCVAVGSATIVGYHEHEEFWDGDFDRGPAGELTIYVEGTYAGSAACPRGCQPVG